jgi:hypothetical protein
LSFKIEAMPGHCRADYLGRSTAAMSAIEKVVREESRFQAGMS